MRYSRTLFEPVKGEFIEENFEEAIKEIGLDLCIVRAVLEGFDRNLNESDNNRKSLRLRNSNLHESIFTAMQDEISVQYPDKEISFTPNVFGNERLSFTYQNYCFILRLAGARTNNTKQSVIIDNQEDKNHIITISYNVNRFENKISSISLDYCHKGKVLYSYPLSITERSHTEPVEVEEVTPIKPRLKSSALMKKVK